MAKYLLNRVDLGKRTVGYEVYISETKEIMGYTEKQIKDMLRSQERVYGFTLDADDSLQLDKEGFHTCNIMVKTGINGLRPLVLSSSAVYMIYVLVGVHKGKETVYEVVNSRFARTNISESRLKALLEFGGICGGAYLDGKGKIAICEGVEVTEESV